MTLPTENNNPTAATVCPECGAAIGTSYILLGAPAVCGTCGRTVVPVIPNGVPYSGARYGVKFSDFQRLLTDQDSLAVVRPLLRTWFGYEASLVGKNCDIRSSEGEPVEMLDVHLNIQADSAKQYDLYQAAMSIWR